MRKLVCLVIITSIVFQNIVFSSIVSDNDGSAFITKAEFEALKLDFNNQIDSYNESIDSKIDGAIANYLASVVSKQVSLTSMLNALPEKRRTFVPAITNPTTCTQDDLYIETSGYWFLSYPRPQIDGRYGGYALCGFNNRISGHVKNLYPMNNGKTSKYLFLNTTKVGDEDVFYITDEYRKKIRYYIYVFGAQTGDASPASFTSARTYGGPTSMSWDNTYNWIGSGSRKVTAQNDTVDTTEVLMLQVDNDDYNTAKAGVNEVDWVGSTSGSTIFTAVCGCLEDKNRLNWSKRITNFSLGWSGQQARWGLNHNFAVSNSYNAQATDKIGLSFNVPQISMLPGNALGIYDVSNAAGVPTYYYSGLPLCNLPDNPGNLKLKLRAIPDNASSGVTIMIKGSQFNNIPIGSESGTDKYFSKTYISTELTKEIEINLDEEEIKDSRGNLLWIKACATDSNSSVFLETTSILYS